MLGDVQPCGLDVRFGTDADRDLEEQEHDERRAQRERADRRQAESLRSELVQAPAVQQAARAGCQLGSEARHREEPERQRSPHARHAVGGDGADRIVHADLLDEEHSKTTITPATKPMITAAQGATNAHDAVIATRPAMAPLSIIDRSGFLITTQAVDTAPSTPAAAAMFVFIAT